MFAMDYQTKLRLAARSMPQPEHNLATTFWAESLIVELGSIAIARFLLTLLTERSGRYKNRQPH
jgi:hypothetical protein